MSSNSKKILKHRQQQQQNLLHKHRKPSSSLAFREGGVSWDRATSRGNGTFKIVSGVTVG